MHTVPVPSRRRSSVAAVAAFVLAVVLAACTGSDAGTVAPAKDGTDSAGQVAPASVDASIPAPTSERMSGTVGDGASTTVVDRTSPTVVDVGVPGIDSDDAFCRSWSRFAGSFQALALASALASDPMSAARAEVAASAAIRAALDGLAEGLPPELESEREAFTVELLGPMGRRADRANADLVTAGLDDAQIEELGTAWLAALTEAGLDDPNISVDVPPALAGPLDDAAERFAAALPAITGDPGLITDASTPSTLAYLSANCPDQGTLAGNDVVDQP